MGDNIMHSADYLRRQEEVAKIRSEMGCTLSEQTYDIGLGKAFLETFADDLEGMLENIMSHAHNGYSAADIGNKRIYVRRIEAEKRVDIGLRSDFVDLCGEETAKRVDAHVDGGKN